MGTSKCDIQHKTPVQHIQSEPVEEAVSGHLIHSQTDHLKGYPDLAHKIKQRILLIFKGRDAELLTKCYGLTALSQCSY